MLSYNTLTEPTHSLHIAKFQISWLCIPKGYPDLTVVLLEKSQVYLVVAEVPGKTSAQQCES